MFSTIVPQFFDQSEHHIAALNEGDYKKFLMKAYDRDTGWRKGRLTTMQGKNCLEEKWTSTYDSKGAREGGAGDVTQTIIAVGDSYTHGDEVEDHQTYPAQLGRLLKTGIANHGEQGYGVVQALRRIKSVIHDYEGVEIILLGIMTHDLRRALARISINAFGYQTLYNLKPYLQDGVIRPNLNICAGGPCPYEKFREIVIYALETDYWVSPKADFPYSLALFRSLTAETNWIKIQEFFYSFVLRDKYRGYVMNPSRNKTLDSVAREYIRLSQTHGFLPVVLIIPSRPDDREYTPTLANFFNDHYGAEGLVTVDVSGFEGNWGTYNISRGCHPSVEGYGIIAKAAAEAIIKDASVRETIVKRSVN